MGVIWHHDDLSARKRLDQPVTVSRFHDLVADDDHASLRLLLSHDNGTLSDIYRTRRRFGHDDRDIDGGLRKTCQRADPGFEVGNDDQVVIRNGTEQLLGRQTASRSTRVRIFDAGDDRQPDTIWCVGAESLEDVVPCCSMVAVTRLFAHGE